MTGQLWSRVVGLGVVVALGLLAVSLPRPAAEAGPDFSEPIAPQTEASASPSLWYCPWINAGANRDTFVGAASVPDVDISFTHPDPRVGEPEDVGEVSVVGPGAVVQDIAEIVNRGDAPGFLEFSDGPATATAIVRGEESLSGDRCVGSVPKLWHLPGLTTRSGYELTLRLFNPIPDNAKVVVRASSELGSEALPDLQSIDVAGKTWEDIDLHDVIPFLDNLVITVSTTEGTVIPVVVQRRATDEASWPGTGLSTEWEFPTATLVGMPPRLSVWNPNEDAVDVAVDLYTRTSVVADAFVATIEGGRPAVFHLSDQSSGAVGVRVRATGAVAAAVVAEDVQTANPGSGDEPPEEEPKSRIAGTVGAPQPSVAWLLPGAGAPVGGESSIWLLNTSTEAVTVTLQPLGPGAGVADKVRLEPETFRRVRLTTDVGVAGYRVDAGSPITVSWSLQSAGNVALFAGVAIGQ
ncbi:MAG: hypothetical protein GY720_16905 [bacterium]|nr:hypothetical protein [bacterium]